MGLPPVDARGTRGGVAPCCHADPLAQGRDHLVPGPVVAPLGKGVIHSALGQHIVRQHIPLAAAAIQVQQGIEDFTPLYLPWAPSSGTQLGRGEQRFHDGPLLVRQLRGVCLARTVLLKQKCALLC
jgi:hypothetical protein